MRTQTPHRKFSFPEISHGARVRFRVRNRTSTDGSPTARRKRSDDPSALFTPWSVEISKAVRVENGRCWKHDGDQPATIVRRTSSVIAGAYSSTALLRLLSPPLTYCLLSRHRVFPAHGLGFSHPAPRPTSRSNADWLTPFCLSADWRAWHDACNCR